MMKHVLLAIACTLGATACSHLREPDDAQLASLLKSDKVVATDAGALLDSNAIDCMRAWSGNDTLMQKLPVGVVSVEGRKACHDKLDGFLADASRNPEKFNFEEVTAPKVVTRAIDLQEARRMAALANPADHVPPAALTRRPETAFAKVDTSVNLGVAGAKLTEAETLCQQAQQAAADPKANPRLKQFAGFCVGNLRQLRTTMQLSVRNGHEGKMLDSMGDSASNVANIARKLLAAGNP